MTNKEAVLWLINITADIGKAEHRDLWHYEQALMEIREMLESQPEIVWCENCKYCRKVDESEYWCYGFCSPARLVKKDDFCSHGCKNG